MTWQDIIRRQVVRKKNRSLLEQSGRRRMDLRQTDWRLYVAWKCGTVEADSQVERPQGKQSHREEISRPDSKVNMKNCPKKRALLRFVRRRLLFRHFHKIIVFVRHLFFFYIFCVFFIFSSCILFLACFAAFLARLCGCCHIFFLLYIRFCFASRPALFFGHCVLLEWLQAFWCFVPKINADIIAGRTKHRQSSSLLYDSGDPSRHKESWASSFTPSRREEGVLPNWNSNWSRWMANGGWWLRLLILIAPSLPR